MGDAAHPMYPIGSNGASQAILDARVLTREILGARRDQRGARRLRGRAAAGDDRLVMLNRRNGPEQVMQIVEERAPDGYNVVTDVLSQKELEDIAANYKRVAGFQVEGLNAKPPIVQLSKHAACGLAAAAFARFDQPRVGVAVASTVPSAAISLPSMKAMVLPSCVTLPRR